jgi:hypothetical protein
MMSNESQQQTLQFALSTSSFALRNVFSYAPEIQLPPLNNFDQSKQIGTRRKRREGPGIGTKTEGVGAASTWSLTLSSIFSIILFNIEI